MKKMQYSNPYAFSDYHDSIPDRAGRSMVLPCNAARKQPCCDRLTNVSTGRYFGTCPLSVFDPRIRYAHEAHRAVIAAHDAKHAKGGVYPIIPFS